jgi:uncharacterized repeat protein (TIGR02543 family)
MKKQIKQLGIMVLVTSMVLMTACDLGMVEKPGHNSQVTDQHTGVGSTPVVEEDEEQTIGSGEENGSEENGGNEVTPLSDNANIRAVSGEGANALYGLYIAGSPGISNGEPQADISGFETHTSTIWGNYTLSDPANNRSIVVIVEDKKVSKVEFGITDNATAAPTSVIPPDNWIELTKNNEYTTADTDGKRWIGTLTSPDRPGASSYREVYVRITAQDGNVQIYRYVQYVSSTAPSGNNAARGELNTLTIGGVNVVTNAKDAGNNKKGTYAGWWNKTVAPEIEAGEVTLTAAQAANGAISATFYYSNEQAGSTVSYAKISAANWPLKESTVTFTDLTTTTTSNIVGSGTISGITNGDYIILRRNPPTSATYSGYYGHYIIKVNVEVPTTTITFDKNGGTTEANPATKAVVPPATTVETLPTAPTRTGYSFDGWNTAANGSGTAFTATTAVTESKTVYAQWTAHTLSISYANGGGTGSGPNTPSFALYDTNVTMPANPYTRDGFNFAGWAVSGEGSTAGGTYQAGISVAVTALSTAIAAGDASITLTATWSDAPVTLSNNANIRAVSGTGADALYGLYIGGMPGIDNGTPRSTADGFSNATIIALSGNNPTANPDRNVVVIVEDKKVSKVEFGINTSNTGSTSLTSNTAPSTWSTLSRNNDFTTPDTVDKRWVGPLTVAIPSSSSSRGVYVRITAEDGTTTQVYRYWQYISTSVSNNVTRGELTALSIGGVDVIKTGAVQGTFSKGIAQGWWNKTVAPDLTPGEVTITASQAANCSVSATVNNGNSGTLALAKISASQWPLYENSALTFTTTGTASGNNPSVSGTFTNVADGDYIIIRQNATTATGSTDAPYKALFTHTIIKVNVQ